MCETRFREGVEGGILDSFVLYGAGYGVLDITNSVGTRQFLMMNLVGGITIRLRYIVLLSVILLLATHGSSAGHGLLAAPL